MPVGASSSVLPQSVHIPPVDVTIVPLQQLYLPPLDLTNSTNLVYSTQLYLTWTVHIMHQLSNGYTRLYRTLYYCEIEVFTCQNCCTF